MPKAGGLVEVEVLTAGEPGRGTLRLAGSVHQATFPPHLAPGQRLVLRLLSAGPPLVLQLPSGAEPQLVGLLPAPAQGLAAAVRVLLTATGTPDHPAVQGQLLDRVGQLLNLPADPEVLASALGRWVAQSGVLFEAALGRGQTPDDLKAVLLKLLDVSPAGGLRDAVRALLGHIEAHQARSVLEDALILPLVLPWGREWVHGELRLLAERGRQARSREGTGALQIRLCLPRLGPVDVHLRWGKPGVSVRLALDPRSLETVRQRLGDLAAAIADGARVRVVDLRAEELPPAAAGGEAGLVEVLA